MLHNACASMRSVLNFFFGKLVVKKSNEHVNQMYEIKWILLAYTAIIVKDIPFGKNEY